jgi:hypothetical protein
MIETTSGKTCNGYAYIYGYGYGLNDTEYLKKELYQQLCEGQRDTINYYQDRIGYEYKHRVWSGTAQKEIEQKDTIYCLMNKKSIPFKDIKTITIDKAIAVSPFEQLSSELQLSDTTWLKQKPVKNVLFRGYLCTHRILVHSNSVKVDNLIRQLELKQKETDKKMKLFAENENDFESVLTIDDELWEIIDKFKREKVVIISVCTD